MCRTALGDINKTKTTTGGNSNIYYCILSDNLTVKIKCTHFDNRWSQQDIVKYITLYEI